MISVPLYIGIDPGVTGALAFLHNGALQAVDVPTLTVRRGRTDKTRVDVSAVWRLVSLWADTYPGARVVIENVGGIRGQSASAAFAFGATAGALEAVCVCAGLVVCPPVAPVTWKNHFRIRGDKDDSRLRAIQLFPAHAALFERKKDHGRAEAALLAEYGRQHGL